MARVFGGSFFGSSFLCLSVEGLWYESRACAVNLVNSAQCQLWESTEFCQLPLFSSCQKVSVCGCIHSHSPVQGTELRALHVRQTLYCRAHPAP